MSATADSSRGSSVPTQLFLESFVGNFALETSMCLSSVGDDDGLLLAISDKQC